MGLASWVRRARERGPDRGVGGERARLEHEAVHPVGASLITYLRNSYPEDLRQEHPCNFRLVASGEMNGDNVDFGTAVTLYLYRVTMNQYLRNATHVNPQQQVSTPLALDLSYRGSSKTSSACCRSVFERARPGVALGAAVSFSSRR